MKKKGKFGNKKSQGLPIHVVVVILLAIIVLVVVLLFAFGIIGEGLEISTGVFDVGENVTENASDVVDREIGR